ncbi:unnamed protein product [Gordionus sp. m RMFG-2023]|uniref:intermediate filament protein A-like n=1 Tax=Gordionus sp. m RMFG-2023 TaxID=3053472 RepID=UPI0030E16EE5
MSKSKSSSHTIEESRTYRSSITPRRAVVVRSGSPTSFLGSGGGGGYTRTTSTFKSFGGGAGGGRMLSPRRFPQSGLSNTMIHTESGDTTIATVVASREKEKKDLQDLNDRLAHYIENVRFLEAQNKKLAADIGLYREKLERISNMLRGMFEAELNQARKVTDENIRERERLEDKRSKLDDNLRDWKDKYGEVFQLRENDKTHLVDIEVELAMKLGQMEALTKKLEAIECDLNRYKKEIHQLQVQLGNVQMNTDEERMLRADLDSKIQAFEEDLVYQNQVHQQELKELLDKFLKDDTDQYRNIFHNELSDALKEIRIEYDNMARQRPDDSYYHTKMQEIIVVANRKAQEEMTAKEDSKKARDKVTELNKELLTLRTENGHLSERLRELETMFQSDSQHHRDILLSRDRSLDELRAKLESQMEELREMLDHKLSLEREIQVYRRLLEEEETRIREATDKVAAVQQIIDEVNFDTLSGRSSGGGRYGGQERYYSSRMVQKESTTKTNVQRSAKGNIAFTEIDPEGKYIILENGSRLKDQNLSGWSIRRKVDDGPEIVFNFPPNTILRSGKSLKIWSNNSNGQNRPPSEIVAYTDFGTGSFANTYLVSDTSEEKASYTQRSLSAI